MASSSTEICNLAIGHLGSGKAIENLEADDSQEAEACRRFYDTTLDLVLRDFAWPFATKTVTLGLVQEDPTEEWQYEYQVPSDSLHVRRILSGARNDTRKSKVAYRLVRGTSGTTIYTDEADAQAEYTVRETDTARYPPDFVMALSLRLAFYIAPSIGGRDAAEMGERALRLYAAEIAKARAAAANEETPDELPDSEFIRERDS